MIQYHKLSVTVTQNTNLLVFAPGLLCKASVHTQSYLTPQWHHRAPQMTSQWPQMTPDVPRCPQMSTQSYLTPPMKPSGTPDDIPMSPDDPRCPQMSPDVHISETLCLPTLTNSDLKAIFGPSLDLLTPISRSELLEHQHNDPDLLPLFQFFKTGFPSIQQFHRLYQSERTGYYFSKRKLLRLEVDGVR